MAEQYPKYTASVSGLGKVSISLRTDSRDELDAFLEEHKGNGKQRTKKRYLYVGDHCLDCDGSMVLRSSERDGEDEFRFLGCSNFPRCEFTAYISKFPKKENGA